MTRIILTSFIATSFGQAYAQSVSAPVPPNVLLENGAASCKRACATLLSKFPSDVYLGRSGDYSFWDAKQQVTPACRVEPTSAQDISTILDVVKDSQCHFAIKSGGHSRFAGSSNADGGVTIDLVKLNKLELSGDKKSVTLGAGLRWEEVYTTLEIEGLTVIGGRAATVGVGGVILGGGLSFFSGRHGLACDSVISFDIVLPSGEITTVNQTHHAELYKALKGAGSGNFGMVTAFTLETISLPNQAGIWTHSQAYAWDKVPELHNARIEWLTTGVGEDFDTGGFDVYVYYGLYNASTGYSHHLHTSHTSTKDLPGVFKQYVRIEALPPQIEGGNDPRILPMSNITREISQLNPYGLRNTYSTFTYKPTKELEEKLFHIMESGLEKVRHVQGLIAANPLQPLSRRALSMMSKRGGNSLGLEEEDGPLVIYLLSWQWERSEDDELIFQTTKDIMHESEKVAKQMRLWHRYKYINYAEEWQADDIYLGYGEQNLKDLQVLQRKYDPESVFTKGGLCGGYFRLNKVSEKQKVKDEL